MKAIDYKYVTCEINKVSSNSLCYQNTSESTDPTCEKKECCYHTKTTYYTDRRKKAEACEVEESRETDACPECGASTEHYLICSKGE